ncbi:MAG TPA: M14 family zinc carboxypeptidase, partial [Gemmatimonadales bacterium]|nr:M14 family zinc carboxypeptidase [Gemmatimonadales bacterium]
MSGAAPPSAIPGLKPGLGRAGLCLGLGLALAAPLWAQTPRRRAPARQAPALPAPRAVLGFEPGEDGKLAEWPTLLRYYQALARTSDRVQYRELGKTTLGQPFVALVISSPRNLARLDRYRALNARLADPRTIRTAAEARSLIRDGRTVVLITSGIHSTEVGGHLTPAVLAHRLATDTT